VNFTVPPDGQWVERTIDLSANANWTGYMSSVRIDPTSASNAVVSVDWVRFVPSGAFAANRPPVLPLLPALSNLTVTAGQTLSFTHAATDPDGMAQVLTYRLVDPPAGATIDASTGALTWRPAISQSPLVQALVVTVTDSGTPSLSATQTVWVTVNRPAQPVISAAGFSGGRFSLAVAGDGGPDYTILASTNLTTWSPIWMTNPPMPPFLFTDPASTNFSRRFYRVLLGP
jgi:hypothetical protein